MSRIFDFCDVEVIDGITIITFKTTPSSGMSRATLDYLAKQNIYHYRVFNFKDLNWLLSHQEVIDIANYSKSIFTEKSFTSFAAENDLAYGTLRELSVYREQEGFTEMAVFRHIDESLEWMRQKKENESRKS